MVLPALLLALADTGAANACGADSMYARAPVYVRVTVANPADVRASPSLLLIAQAVAQHVRTALGAPPDSVPRGDAAVAAAHAAVRRDSAARARSVNVLDSAGLRVVARRDGSIRWTPMWAPAAPTPPLPTTALLDRALGDAKAADETFIVPEQFAADSIAFALTYEVPTAKVDGVLRPAASRPAALAAFTVRAPLRRDAAEVPGTLEVRYPETTRRGGADAHAVMAFEVDTNGRAVASTVHDVWPQDRPRLQGTAGDYYRLFVEAATDAVLRARFSPAEVAGCRVRQAMSMPVTWKLLRPERPGLLLPP